MAGDAHGDLQHGNVMVRDDHTPVLVDYDGMCVPRLISDPPKPCFEFGLKGYVHPLRDTESLSLNLDHFPAWVILIALRASAADPSLFQRFVEEPEIENMLFSAADMANPASSKLWPELFKSPDAEVRTWAKDLHTSLDRPFSLIPPFQTDAFATLIEVCAAPTMDWETIQVEAERITASGKPLPQSLHPSIRAKVETAKKKMASRAALHTALETARNTGDPRGVAATIDPAIYTDWPKHEGFVKQVNRAINCGKLLTELEAAAKSSPDGRKLLAVWDRAKPEFDELRNRDKLDVHLAQNLGNQAEAWRAKIAADGFIAAASLPNQTESELAAAWARALWPPVPHMHRSRPLRRIAARRRLCEHPFSMNSARFPLRRPSRPTTASSNCGTIPCSAVVPRRPAIRRV